MTDRPADHTRRKLLRRLGLAATAAYAAPALLFIRPARASGSAGSSFSGRAAPRPAPPPEIVVSAPDPAVIDLIAAQGFALLARTTLSALPGELARFALPPGVSVDAARQQIADIAPQALFDLNAIYRPQEFACAEGECAAFETVGWSPALRRCATGARIGMIDTGVNTDHAALAGVEIETLRVISEDREPGSAAHGTAIAVMLAGRADTRTPGLLAEPSVVAAEAFHRDATGADIADTFDIVRAINLILGRDLPIVNLSFSGPANAVLEAIVAQAVARDVLLVAAAGNAGPGSEPLYPAAYAGVVAVTAVDKGLTVYRRANRGDYVDFAAPGVRLWTAASISGGRFRSGTSFAVPFVSAALAAARTEAPDLAADELVSRLADAAVDLGEAGRDDVYGWGLVQSETVCGDPSVLPVRGG